MKIAVTKSVGKSIDNYVAWLRAVREDVNVLELAGLSPDEARTALREADGLLLSGGADVDPIRYEREDLRSVCSIDAARDEMEFALIEESREMRMPVLGICRGMQILNVAYGGTLIADIPSQHSTEIEHRQDVQSKEDAVHQVELQPGTIMRHFIGVFDGQINSAHHQCVEHLADVFTASAYSPDGIIEALEWGDASLGGKPFLYAVQWHPERLPYENPMSLPIAQHFLLEVDAYRVLVKSVR